MAKAAKDFIVVVAIDFGTTYSGYAFSFRTNPEKIFMSKSWGGPSIGYKTTTSLLVTKNMGAVTARAFGHEAEDLYGEYLIFEESEEANEKLYLFRRFKMQLYGQKLDHNSKLTSVDGSLDVSAIDVFKMALKCMKEKAMDDIGKSVKSGLKDGDVLWVLTVPAIWSEAAKDFMRTAAYRAGLIKSQYSTQLVIALEPEAASIYCRSKEVGCVFDQTKDGSMPAGTKYLVVDSGGGTVDIASHEILEDGGIKELYKPSGGDWGGTQVDCRFIDMLTEILSENFIKAFQEKSTMSWLQLLFTFEKKKREKSTRMSLEVQRELSEQCHKITGKSLVDTFAEYKKKGGNAAMTNGYMVFRKEVVQELFLPVIKKIINHVDDLLRKPELSEVSCLMLVGGFSECELLQQEFRRRFEPRMKVIIPQETVLAVMSGAVMFGYKPTSITSRIARHTYGFAVNEDYVVGKHDRSKAVTGLNGQLVVKDIFSPFVMKGEQLRSDDVRTKQFYPSSSSAHTGVLKLYCTDQDNITYTYDRGVKEIGCITVHIPPNSNLDVPMDVDIRFGGTEVIVEMKDPDDSSQVRASATVSFLA